MSKQSEAKKAQGYDDSPIVRICFTCEYYRSRCVPDEYGEAEEIDRHCGFGGFAIKKMATCKRYERKD